MAMVANPGITPATTHNLLSSELSTKYKLRMSNLCAQHGTVAELKHCHTITCVRVNATGIILQLILVMDGRLLGVRLGATKGTYQGGGRKKILGPGVQLFFPGGTPGGGGGYEKNSRENFSRPQNLKFL